MIWAKIAEYALGILNTLTGWAKQTSDQNTGRVLQNADNQAANLKADENAAIIADDNARLGHDDLVAKLHKQTGVSP